MFSDTWALALVFCVAIICVSSCSAYQSYLAATHPGYEYKGPSVDR